MPKEVKQNWIDAPTKIKIIKAYNSAANYYQQINMHT